MAVVLLGQGDVSADIEQGVEIGERPDFDDAMSRSHSVLFERTPGRELCINPVIAYWNH